MVTDMLAEDYGYFWRVAPVISPCIRLENKLCRAQISLEATSFTEDGKMFRESS
jgi:hypothetical protein